MFAGIFFMVSNNKSDQISPYVGYFCLTQVDGICLLTWSFYMLKRICTSVKQKDSHCSLMLYNETLENIHGI